MEKKIGLSKTKYCYAFQCPKMLWLDIYKREEKSNLNNDSIFDNGTEVGILAQQLFGTNVNIEFDNNLQNMVNDTLKALEKKSVIITEASFVYQNCFCSVDILVKKDDEIEIYEVKSSTEITDIYIEDLSYQVYVLKSLGYNIVSSSIVYLNKDYIRHGELELQKLFNIEDLTTIVNKKLDQVKENIEQFQQVLLQKNEPINDLSLKCVKPYECPFFNYCTKDLPKNNVFSIRQMHNKIKFDLYNKGIYSFEDLLKENIGSKFKQQIEFELYDKEPVIEKDAIKKFLNTLSYPLYFLDFETYQQSIPQFDGIKPYMQIPFQYSLHYIEKEGKELKHKEFLGEAAKDPRRTLAESLVKDIPLDVCTLAYNMSFEKSVIKNLAYLFPDLHDHLMNIYDNIKDLMIPFSNRNYYTKEMQGSYSIKYVLPALFSNDPSLNYHNLNEIHNGKEAMESFANLNNYPKEKQQEIRKNLLAYCGLDTYAMVKVWEKLKEVTEEIKN